METVDVPRINIFTSDGAMLRLTRDAARSLNFKITCSPHYHHLKYITVRLLRFLTDPTLFYSQVIIESADMKLIRSLNEKPDFCGCGSPLEQHLKNPTGLDLSGCVNITDSGFGLLRSLRNLTDLDCSKCAGITASK